MSKGTQIIVGATAIAVLVGWFLLSNAGGIQSFQYYETLEEFRAEGVAPGELARVHGFVVTGSIQRDPQARQVRFLVQNDPPHAAGVGGDTLPVLFRSLEVPDLFKDGAEVVVEGSLAGQGNDAVFVADTVLAKCPSKFQAAPGEEPQAASL